jgi:mRNA interferase MazF
MSVDRGDIVLVDYPFSDRTGSKLRPSLVVQASAINRLRADTILAIITSKYSGRATELLIDIAQEPGSGLRFNSAVQCDTLVTLDQSLILRVLGSLSAQAMRRADDCLKPALGLP